jgi:acetyl-CoA acetyltransferase
MARKHKAAIVGLGHSRITRRAEQPLGVLAVEAVNAALTDCGISAAQIDGISSSPQVPFHTNFVVVDGVHFVTAHLLSRIYGIHATWGHDEEYMVGNSLAKTIEAIEAGACTHALVVRALHSPAGVYGETVSDRATGRDQYALPYGSFYPGGFAQLWSRYRDKYRSGSREQMATFVTQSRTHGLLNPHGYWTNFKPTPLTVEEYLNARMVSAPLGLYDCDIPIQGAAAFVITTAERAADLGVPAAYVHGVANPYMPSIVNMGAMSLEIDEDSGKRMADILWNDAGIGPSDVSTAELYDGFSISAIQWLEGLGLCDVGSGFDFIQDGRTTLGGKLPLNLSGGSLGAGRMHGVTHLMGAMQQVMGRAGAVQVKDARFSVAAVGGPMFGAAIVFGQEPQQ